LDVHIHRPKDALVAILAAAMLIAGCGGSSDGGGDSSAALKASDINPVPREHLKPGGVMRWGINEFPTQLNFNQVDGKTDSGSKIIYAVMPRPFRVDAEAKVTPNPNYLLSASVTTTVPRQVVRYRLNPKATWSDGTPITWRDYEAQWKALRNPNGAFKITSSTGYERIASIRRGADDYEFAATFSKPFGEWQSIFDPLYPRSVNGDPKRFDSEYKNKIPVTGGAFRVKEIDRSAETITIERNPDWWGEKPLLDAIVFREMSQDALIGAFAGGKIDFAELGADAAAYKRAAGVAGGAVREASGPDFRHFTFNGSRGVLKDAKVRRAIAMALDREVLAKADLAGLNWPVRTMGNHYLVNTQEGYADNAREVGTFDPATSRALLDEAGWKLDGPFRRKAGKTLAVRFVIPLGIATSRQEGELAGKMLRDVGVKLDIRTVPSDDFFEHYVTAGNFDISAFSWIGTPFPISFAKSIYAAPAKDDKGELQIHENFARVGSDLIDSIMRQAEEEVDRAKAFDLINQVDKLVWDEVHSLTLYQRPQIAAVRSTLANVGAKGLAYDVYEDIGFVK
jgi:glutathione transport system substrate-binding protein